MSSTAHSESQIIFYDEGVVKNQVVLLKKSFTPTGITFFDAIKKEYAPLVLYMLKQNILEADSKWSSFSLHQYFQTNHVYHFGKNYTNHSPKQLQDQLMFCELVFFKNNSHIYRTNPFGEPLLVF